MADEEKKTTKKPAVQKAKAKTDATKKSDTVKKPEYDTAYIANQLNKKTNVVRIMLRKAGIKKNEKGGYSWSNKTEVDAIIKKLAS